MQVKYGNKLVIYLVAKIVTKWWRFSIIPMMLAGKLLERCLMNMCLRELPMRLNSWDWTLEWGNIALKEYNEKLNKSE